MCAAFFVKDIDTKTSPRGNTYTGKKTSLNILDLVILLVKYNTNQRKNIFFNYAEVFLMTNGNCFSGLGGAYFYSPTLGTETGGVQDQPGLHREFQATKVTQ